MRVKLVQLRNRISAEKRRSKVVLQEGEERSGEAESEREEMGTTSFLEVEYEAPRSVRYYTPEEMPRGDLDA